MLFMAEVPSVAANQLKVMQGESPGATSSSAATRVIEVSTAKPPPAHRGEYDHHVRGIDLPT